MLKVAAAALVAGVVASLGSPSSAAFAAPAGSAKPVHWPTRAIPVRGLRNLVSLDGQLYGQRIGRTTAVFTLGLPAPVVRVDLRSGRVVASSALLPAGELVAGAGRLWLAAAPDPTDSYAGEVYVLDPKTLKILRQIPLPTGPPPTVDVPEATGPAMVAMSDGAIWAGTGTEAVRINPKTGATGTPVTFASPLGGLAVGGGRLYDSYEDADTNQIGVPVVEERDATTGALLASAEPDAIAPPALVAAAGTAGVWASFRGGMIGTTELLAPSGLAVAPEPEGNRVPWLMQDDGSVYTQFMGTAVTRSGGVGWVSSDVTLACADPATGAVRAVERHSLTTSLSSFAAIGSRLYALRGAGGRLVEITPPAAC